VRGTDEELYDYGVLRKLDQATMFVVHLERPTLVLGGSQSRDVVDLEKLGPVPLRRRRGGGGLVLLQPGDIWIDWWIPADDPRWSRDVHVSSLEVGSWWRDVLQPIVSGVVTVHAGSLTGDAEYRVVCFAGRGPGEVFVDGKKAVGVTQWRVREGIFLSSVLHTHPTLEVLDLLRDVPDGIARALDHHTLSSMGISSPDELVTLLEATSGPWQVRQLLLSA
jgi:lipoate-protein ligase A